MLKRYKVETLRRSNNKFLGRKKMPSPNQVMSPKQKVSPTISIAHNNLDTKEKDSEIIRMATDSYRRQLESRLN